MKATIKSKSDIERLFEKGRRSSSYSFIIIEYKNMKEDGGRCAFIAGKKLGCAPLRSRCKRVMREIARELGGPWDGHDVIFIARKSVATGDYRKLLSKAKGQLKELGICA